MASEEEALELLKEAADIVPYFGAIVGFTLKLNEFVNRPGGDPMLRALGKVHNELAALNDAVLASWVTAREDNLAFLRAHSSASLITANNYLQSGSPSGDVEWEAKKAIAERDSLIAVQTLIGDMNGGLWRRPQSNGAISQMGDPTGWMNSMPDRAEVDSFNRVWDHRWALPATIYAITTRIAVLKAFSAPDEILKPELQRYVDFLGAVFRKMESGLRFKRDFTNYEINYMVVPGGRTPVAAVDIYGGYFIHNVFTIYFNPAEFEGFPYFPGIVLLTHVLELNYILDNVKRVGRYWRDIIAQQIGLPELLWICGQLENLIEPPQPFTVRKHFYGETGEGSETAGVIFSVQPNGDLHWYRYVGNGEADVSGSTGWHPNSGNRIGNGWHMFNKLVCCGDGVILGIEPNGTLRWYRYVGHGEDDVSGSTGWHQNSGNPIGNGWQLMRNLIALKSVYATYGLTILTVAQNGDLLWHSYGGNGESDITGRTGWHPNSGNPIGNGWQGHRHLHGSGNVIFAVRENGDLHWYRYDGDGQADVSGSTGWFENSGNRVATGWHTFRHIFGGATDYVGYGQVLFTVSENGDLLWHRYAGLGWADISGWIANSGNAIGNGW